MTMTQPFDPFRPRSAPARTIYDAFQDEAAKRPGRTVAEWQAAERQAVLQAAILVAASIGAPTVPTDEAVARAERYASGSIDYGAKLAYVIVDEMHEERPAPLNPPATDNGTRGHCRAQS